MSRLPRRLESLARMLIYMLGHRPDEFGLVPAADGFIPLKQLLAALAAEPGWGFVRRHHLEEVAGLSQPPPFEIQGDRIRARHPGPAPRRRPAGQSLPSLLYLAIPAKAHPRVWEEGLKPPPAQELVLTSTPEAALKMGGRRGAAVLVTIRAQAAARAGVSFKSYGEELFLAPPLPREFLQMPAPPPSKEKPKPAQPARPPAIPGALIMDLSEIIQGAAPKPRKYKGEPAWKAGARKKEWEKRGKGERGKRGK
jgi:putative RNA 2'-phosphotransferase